MLHSMPMPGDVVRVDGYYVGTRLGAFAVLGGVLGQARDEYEACFSASAFRDGQVVSCSGGPVPYIGADELRPTGEVREQIFWRWKDGLPGAGRADHYVLEVPVWSWVPGSSRARIEKALDTYRFWAADGALWLRDAQAASRVLGYPVVERPMPDVRQFLSDAVPAALGEFAVRLCNRGRIGGSSDVNYIANVVAFETGRGDGCGVFYSEHRQATRDDVRRICDQLFNAYGCSLIGRVTWDEVAWHLASALALSLALV